MIYRDISPRGSGKSTRLLKRALAAGYNIAIPATVGIRYYHSLAMKLGVPDEKIQLSDDNSLFIDGVHVASIRYWLSDEHRRENNHPILVDDMSACMAAALNGKIAGYSDDNEI